MSNYYAITEESLTSIGDALRERLGETRMEEAELPREVMKVAKSYNAISHTEWNGVTPYTYGDNTTLVIEDASKVKVVLSYSLPGNCYLSIYKAGLATSENLIKKYNPDTNETTITTDELIIEGNTAHFVFYNTEPQDVLGFYADVYGLDENGVELSPTYIGEVEVKNTFKPGEMGPAIENLPTAPSAKAFVVTGDCQYRFANGGWDWFIEQYGNQVTTKDITTANNMFYSCKCSELPFDINFKDGSGACNYMFSNSKFTRIPSIDFKHKTYQNTGYLFNYCTQLTEVGKISNLYPADLSSLFNNCYYLRYFPEIENWNFSRINSYVYASAGSLFYNCNSLRSVPENFLREAYGIHSSSYNSLLYQTFYCCGSLDEVRGLRGPNVAISSNFFNLTFYGCTRVKDIIFAVDENGNPYVQNWKSQVIDLSSYIGYSDDVNSPMYNRILNYNSGITADKWVYDDATYQALKNDPDWFTTKLEYSRYNHDSAVNTINSLPDCSASGGTNTIKFQGNAGSATDGGAINTLTPGEIAVATVKGWTVTLV